MVVEISNDVELKNGKSNLHGWSQSEIWYRDKQIGWLESGNPDLYAGYTYTIKEEGNISRLKIFKNG